MGKKDATKLMLGTVVGVILGGVIAAESVFIVHKASKVRFESLTGHVQWKTMSRGFYFKLITTDVKIYSELKTNLK